MLATYILITNIVDSYWTARKNCTIYSGIVTWCSCVDTISLTNVALLHTKIITRTEPFIQLVCQKRKMMLCVEQQKIMLTDNKYNYFRIMILSQLFWECKRFPHFFLPFLRHNPLSSLFVLTFCSRCNIGTVPQQMKAITLWINQSFAKMDAEVFYLTKTLSLQRFFLLLHKHKVGITYLRESRR